MARAYKIVMMGKQEIQIDVLEIPKVMQAIATGSPAILKQGIFNPSSYSCIIEDDKREMVQEKDEIGHYIQGRYVPKELPDIFAGVEELVQLKTVTKQLN